jgi:hypothetical protein
LTEALMAHRRHQVAAEFGPLGQRVETNRVGRRAEAPRSPGPVGMAGPVRSRPGA